MIDVKAPLRTAYYQLLNGRLNYNGSPVTVSDSVQKLNGQSNLYVIMTQQNGSSENTHHSWNSNETMQLDIVMRGTRVAKAVVDNIASQILTLVFPAPWGNGLPAQPNITIINARVTDDREMVYTVAGGDNVTRRLITITQYVNQGGTTYPVAASSSPYYNPNKIPNGTINGTNLIFTTPTGFQIGTTEVYVNGVRQTLGTHYTETLPNTITFIDAPVAGDILQVDYISI